MCARAHISRKTQSNSFARICGQEHIFMDVYEKSLKLHADLRGKYEVRSLVEVKDRESLSLA